MVQPIGIIEMGTAPDIVLEKVGSQSQWFIDALELKPEEYRIYRPEQGEPLPQKDEISCVIVSGSWSMVTEALDWSERVAIWIRAAVEQEIPILGVCYGHQLMAYALGGTVQDNPKGAEQGLRTLCVVDDATINDPLLKGLDPKFPAWLCHHQTVSQPPPGAEILLSSEQDQHQMIRYNAKTYSVQFHPEFSRATMTACYAAEGKLTPQVKDELALCNEPSQALAVLRRFIESWR